MNKTLEQTVPMTGCSSPHTKQPRDSQDKNASYICECASPFLAPLTYRDLTHQRVGCSCLAPVIDDRKRASKAVRANDAELFNLTVSSLSTEEFVSTLRQKIKYVLQTRHKAVRADERLRSKMDDVTCLDYASRLELEQTAKQGLVKPRDMTKKEITLKIMRRLIVQMKKCGLMKPEVEKPPRCITDVFRRHIRLLKYKELIEKMQEPEPVKILEGECIKLTPEYEPCPPTCHNQRNLTEEECMNMKETMDYLWRKDPFYDWDNDTSME